MEDLEDLRDRKDCMNNMAVNVQMNTIKMNININISNKNLVLLLLHVTSLTYSQQFFLLAIELDLDSKPMILHQSRCKKRRQIL